MSSHDHPEENLDYGERASVADTHHAVRREKEEPQAGREPVSAWATVVSALVLIGGGSYLGAYHGGFKSDSIYAVANYTPDKPPAGADGVIEDTRPWNEKWIADGKKTYGVTCAACHGPTGQGQPGLFPPLAGSEWVTDGNHRPTAIIIRGMMGPIQVKGQNFNGAMPSQANLSDKQIAQVMSYVRNSWGNQAPLVTEEMVAAAREQHGAQASTPWTSASIQSAIPAEANLPGAEVDPLTGEPLGGDTPPAE